MESAGDYVEGGRGRGSGGIRHPPRYEDGDQQVAYGRSRGTRGRGFGRGRSRGGLNFREPRICRFYAAGFCRFGDECRNVHTEGGQGPIEPRPCKYFAQGQCRFGDSCRNLHVMDAN